MILQRDERLPEEIQKYGCYLMSLFFLANKHTNCMWDAEAIINAYETLVQFHYINLDCFIRSPQQVCDTIRWPVHYTDEVEAPDRLCGADESEILRFVWHREKGNWVHFVVGDGHSHVTYDPWGVSNAVRFGELEDKRIFRRIR